ncbi:MAG: PD-(D/E)XK nuclease family protein, partial [Desulfurobacteriaceae bacterium]
KERYTITGDLLSFLICPRQYGLYKFYGFASSNPTQEWYGSVIHRFLKRAHTIYRRKGKIIGPDDVEPIFRVIESSMEVEGIKPSSLKVREQVIEVLKSFCQKLGRDFFPKVEETELRLVAELPHFILYGIVDALKEEKGGYEIWDYKGMNRPDPSTPYGSRKLDMYRKQLYVYAYLFSQKNGSYPKRGVLIFMNELIKERGEPFLYIDFSKKEVQQEIEGFIEEFSEVVEQIERCKENDNWPLPEVIDRFTCLQCDFRWNCEKFSSLG